MKILVTGCSGRVGAHTVTHLLARGHEVRGIDLNELEDERVDFRSCDLMDFGALEPHVRGVDAVLHLAAHASPRGARPEQVFALNDAGSFNVYQACAEAGVRRVVAASSINAIGFFYGTEPFDLGYLPVDEDHPCRTSDAYSFSKQVLEEMGRYFWRREGISNASLRFGAVLRPMETFLEEWGEGYREARRLVEDLAAKEPAERREEVRRMRAAYDRARKRRAFEKGGPWEGLTPAERRVMSLVHNYFTFVDLRDAARGMELALTAEYAGSHPPFILDAHNSLGMHADSLAETFYEGVPVRGSLVGTQSLAAWQRAKELIGFEAEHSIAEHYEELYG